MYYTSIVGNVYRYNLPNGGNPPPTDGGTGGLSTCAAKGCASPFNSQDSCQCDASCVGHQDCEIGRQVHACLASGHCNLTFPDGSCNFVCVSFLSPL